MDPARHTPTRVPRSPIPLWVGHGPPLGWQQTKVSKLELGTQLPTLEELDIWVAAVGAGERERAELGASVWACLTQGFLSRAALPH